MCNPSTTNLPRLEGEEKAVSAPPWPPSILCAISRREWTVELVGHA